MTKIVYNQCYGGFGLSKEALEAYAILAGKPLAEDFHEDMLRRDDPKLVIVVEKLGAERASGPYSALAIRELAPGTKYRIDEYDGWESVMTIDEYNWETA